MPDSNTKQPSGTPVGRLDGWKSIAAYTGRSERQLQRWAVERQFPVHRVPGGGAVFAWPNEIDAWFASGAANGERPHDTTASPGAPEASGAPDSLAAQVPLATARVPPGPAAASAPHMRLVPLLVGTLVAGVSLGALTEWLLLRPAAPSKPVAATPVTPCHVVDWPTQPLSARGGRVRLGVKATTMPCDWQQPVTESTWLLVTPPAFAPVPPRITGNGIDPFSLPVYNPAATSLWLEFVANSTATRRSAVLYFGTEKITIAQEGSRTRCVSEPGPGYVHEGWRYRITARRYRESADLAQAPRDEVGPQAEPVSWPDLEAIIQGNPEAGVAFADAVGLARHTWEEDFVPENCLNYWLAIPYRTTVRAYPDFISYHLNRKPASYQSYFDFNANQFDLGRFHQEAQILYRERVK